MIRTTLKIDSVKSVNLLDLDSQIIEEQETSLVSRIIFERGDWHSCTVNIKKLYLEIEDIVTLREKNIHRNSGNIPFRIGAKVDLNVDISRYLSSSSNSNASLQLYTIDCQVGLENSVRQVETCQDDSLCLYLAPREIYRSIIKKNQSLRKIQELNNINGIKNTEIESWVLNLRSVISNIDMAIDTRLRSRKCV